ncbi:MAG: glycosyltransferase family protein [Clostridiaceae bacterium]
MKVLCIVQARMGSERLPGKVVKKMVDKPMIIYTLERLSKSKYIDEIILATSKKESEEPLINIVKGADFHAFRGNENNVLKRYKEASEEYYGDIIVRVTGDCPLIDPVIVDNAITYFKMNDFDYVRLDVPNSFIRGFDVEVFSKKALDKAFQHINDLENKITNSLGRAIKKEKYSPIMYREHVTLYMYNHPEKFKIGHVKGDSFYNKNYRLCVDTIEDFNLVKHIYEHFNNTFVTSKEVVEFLDSNPKIASINSEVGQRI